MRINSLTETVENDRIRATVRTSYGKIAAESGSCCSPSCCSENIGSSAEKLGYTVNDLASVPEGANLGLGCGNPLAIASLKAGETVLDLGSGAGFDCFLASKAVGATGKVIGVDMTPEMISKARANSSKGSYTNVEFRLGEIEHLPVANESVDAVISNCVINLSPDKQSVIRDIYRVLKKGGRAAISDIVAIKPLPREIKEDLMLLSGCVAGATPIEELHQHLVRAGFSEIKITEKSGSREFIREWAPDRGIENYVTSAIIEAQKL